MATRLPPRNTSRLSSSPRGGASGEGTRDVGEARNTRRERSSAAEGSVARGRRGGASGSAGEAGAYGAQRPRGRYATPAAGSGARRDAGGPVSDSRGSRAARGGGGERGGASSGGYRGRPGGGGGERGGASSGGYRGRPGGGGGGGERGGASSGGYRGRPGGGGGGGERGGTRGQGAGASGPATVGGKTRRALSMPRAPGAIFADGERHAAQALAEALAEAARDSIVADSLTHPVHSYPARMHPATARGLVALVAETMPANTALLDPFCGSGTSLVEACAAGLPAIGIDLNPLAALLAHAKTWMAHSKRRAQLRQLGRSIGGEAILAGKEARRAQATVAGHRKPEGFDPNARDRRIGKWFAPHVRRELEYLAGRIDQVRKADDELADVLTVALSAILYKVSSRTSDTNPEWVARTIGRGQCARLFSDRVEMLVAGLDDLARAFGAAAGRTPTQLPEIFMSDARTINSLLQRGTVGGIVTSPPYAGTYDYAEHQRLRFDFLGLRHREFDAGEIGARRRFNDAAPNARANAVSAWQQSLAETFEAFAEALPTGGRAAIVIGDSLAGGGAMFALDDVRSALSDALVVEAWASQDRPMLGSGERRAFGERPKQEHLILLRKV